MSRRTGGGRRRRLERELAWDDVLTRCPYGSSRTAKRNSSYYLARSEHGLRFHRFVALRATASLGSEDGWRGHGVLLQYTRGSRRTRSGTSGEARSARFAGWYVEHAGAASPRRAGFARRTRSWISRVAADGTWQWKDEAELRDWVRLGRFTEAEAEAIGRKGSASARSGRSRQAGRTGGPIRPGPCRSLPDA